MGNMTPGQHAKEIEDAAMAYASTASECARRGLVTPDQCWKSLKAAIIAGVGAAPPEPENIREGAPYDSTEFEAMAREFKVWGRASSAMCAQFWLGGMREKAAPEGWQLVPVAPTHAMLAAAAITRAEYSAMLAAAPKPYTTASAPP